MCSFFEQAVEKNLNYRERSLSERFFYGFFLNHGKFLCNGTPGSTGVRLRTGL